MRVYISVLFKPNICQISGTVEFCMRISPALWTTVHLTSRQQSVSHIPHSMAGLLCSIWRTRYAWIVITLLVCLWYIISKYTCAIYNCSDLIVTMVLPSSPVADTLLVVDSPSSWAAQCIDCCRGLRQLHITPAPTPRVR